MFFFNNNFSRVKQMFLRMVKVEIEFVDINWNTNVAKARFKV